MRRQLSEIDNRLQRTKLYLKVGKEWLVINLESSHKGKSGRSGLCAEPSWTAEGKLQSIVLINSTRGSIKEKVFKRTGHQVDDRKNHKLVHFSRSRALKPWRSSLIEDVPLIPASERGTLESFVDSTTDSAGKNNCRVP